MGIWDFLILLLVAAIIGAIGEALAGFSPGGLAMSIVIGFVGAYIGRWLQAQFHIKEWLPIIVAGHDIHVVWSVIGAALFVLVLRLIMGRRTYIAN